MSGIPLSGTTTGAAGVAGVAGVTGEVPQSFGGGTIESVVGALPTTGYGLLAWCVAGFTLIACGLALLSLVRPAASGPPRRAD